MRLLSFFRPGTGARALGVDLGGQVGDLSAWGAAYPELQSMEALVAAGRDGLGLARRGRDELSRRTLTQFLYPAASLRVDAPLRRPGKIIGIGLNYRDHAIELNMPVPARPVVFAKFANAIVGPGEAVVMPPETARLDYEAELAVVIGRPARRVPLEAALDHVFGYACANDVSARDLQFQDSQWTPGKVCDTFLPLGPYIATADAVPEPQNLRIRLYVNGELRQDSSTAQMIFGVAELVHRLSQTMTLEPGDLILTGTPPGVAQGMKPEPRWLRPGDRLRVEIDEVGALENPVAAEPRG